MHLTTKLFFTATLLAGNLFASFAGDVTLKITKKYINLPVSHQVDRKKMTFEVKGTPERNFVIRLADEKPDYWVFCDVSSWKGKTLRISYEGESAGLEKIYQDDVIAEQDSLYAEKNRPQFLSPLAGDGSTTLTDWFFTKVNTIFSISTTIMNGNGKICIGDMP